MHVDFGADYLKGSLAWDFIHRAMRRVRANGFRAPAWCEKRNMKVEAAKFGGHEPFAQGCILAVATAIVVTWVLTKPIVFTYDSLTYIQHARELQLGRSAESMFPRLPLFPAILLAFNVTDSMHSVFWLIVFQSCLAVVSCWLFYLTARLIAPRGAFAVSLVFIASLLPFLNVKYVMTEQTFLFETVLTFYGIVAYLLAATKRQALVATVVMGVGATLMTLTRPQGAYVIPLVFAIVGALVWRRAWLPLIAAVAAFGSVWCVQAVDQKIRAGSDPSAGSLDNSHLTGAMLLFTFYLDGPRVNIRISPENGPATAEFKALLLDELAKPDTAARRAGFLKSVPPQDVPAYVERILKTPDSTTWTMLAFTALKERLGAKEADRLFIRVSLEAALAYPVETAGLFIERMFGAYFNPTMLAVPVHPRFPPATFQSPLAEEIAASGDYEEPTEIDRAIDGNLHWLMQGAIVLVIITLPVALWYSAWRVTVALSIIGLYLNFAATATSSPLFRYTMYTIPATLLCAYVGTVASIAAVRGRYLKKSVA